MNGENARERQTQRESEKISLQLEKKNIKKIREQEWRTLNFYACLYSRA